MKALRRGGVPPPSSPNHQHYPSLSIMATHIVSTMDAAAACFKANPIAQKLGLITRELLKVNCVGELPPQRNVLKRLR
ncbi:hypothetical protein AOLI_G00231310 [Acnodon oligacanthus]